jgi:hypothetical protein
MHRRTLWAALIIAVLTAPSNRLVRSLPFVTRVEGPVQVSNISTRSLPLAFEPNLGQVDRQVKFLARGDGYTLWLTAIEAVLQLRSPMQSRLAPQVSAPPETSAARAMGTATTIRMRMLGANPGTTLTGLVPLAVTTSYFIGNDPTRWRSHVPTFSKVCYENVYPGIDLVFHGEQRALEYDWVVRPGGDPRAIELAFDGASHLELDTNGDLLVQAAEGRDIVRQHKPVVYQENNGWQQPIDVGYIVERDGHVKLWTADYNPQITLVIDPVLDYATYLGGSGANGANAIAVDADGNAYVVGTTTSADFPLKNALQPTVGSSSSAFIAKLNHNGSGLVYATYLGGGNGNQEATAVAVDEGGHAFVTGYTTATNFPVTPGAFQVALGGDRDAFVAKLNATGDALMYASYLGGRQYDAAWSIALDDRGDAYVAGSTGSRDFPFTPGAFRRGQDASTFGAFVAKVSPDGRELTYAVFLDDSAGRGIAVDSAGSAYVTGNTTDNFRFPTTPGAFQTGRSGYVFVTKLTPDGAGLVYSTRLGGTVPPVPFGLAIPSDFEGVRAIAIDEQGNAYVTGFTDFADFPTTAGVLAPKYRCKSIDDDAFVTKLNADGSALIYSTYIDGCGQSGTAITVDRAGHAYVVGFTGASDLPVTADALQSALAGAMCGSNGQSAPCLDAFLVKLDPSGTRLLYSTYLGGPGDDWATGVALDSAGNVYLAGQAGEDFPTTPGASQSVFSGQCDVFVAKLNIGVVSLSNSVLSRISHLSTTGTPRGVFPGAFRAPRGPRVRNRASAHLTTARQSFVDDYRKQVLGR